MVTPLPNLEIVVSFKEENKVTIIECKFGEGEGFTYFSSTVLTKNLEAALKEAVLVYAELVTKQVVPATVAACEIAQPSSAQS